MKSTNINYFYYKSPIGILEICFTMNKIVKISKISIKKSLLKNKIQWFSFKKVSKNLKIKRKVNAENIKLYLDHYFSGRDQFQTLSIDFKGTVFQKKVWNFLRKIPFGEKKTYLDVATAIGRKKAVRAVGTACGMNPCLLAVPCHRVIAKRGLGGFALGLAIKSKLLNHEQNEL